MFKGAPKPHLPTWESKQTLKWQLKQTIRKNFQAMLVNFPTIRSFRLCLFHAINKPEKGCLSS